MLCPFCGGEDTDYQGSQENVSTLSRITSTSHYYVCLECGTEFDQDSRSEEVRIAAYPDNMNELSDLIKELRQHKSQ